MQIVQIAALRAVLERWRRHHGEERGCWIHSDEIEPLIEQIAKTVQQPAPGEKIYGITEGRETVGTLENINVSRNNRD